MATGVGPRMLKSDGVLVLRRQVDTGSHLTEKLFVMTPSDKGKISFPNGVSLCESNTLKENLYLFYWFLL